MSILIAVLCFAVMLVFHELGHFLTAKWAGIKVNEFAVGMGPKLFSIKRGETAYSLRLFPIGAFVAMEGEDDGSEIPTERSFMACPVWKRHPCHGCRRVYEYPARLHPRRDFDLRPGTDRHADHRRVQRGSSSAEYLKVDDRILAVNGEQAV
jgi:regulator of sigma E protease